MKPGLLVRWTRQKQLKDNRAHFAAKNLQYSVDVQKDLNYMGDGSPFHTMDIYGPKGSDAVLPVILLIHGGGYVSCEKFINAGQAGFLAQEGARVVNVNYSLQPEADFFDVMRELFCALHWIEQNAAAQHFDPKGIRHEYREYTSEERKLGHVFNVTDPEWPESIAANREMLAWVQSRRALRERENQKEK